MSSYATLRLSDEQAILQILETAYLHGAYIDREAALMEQGFHADFDMLIRQGNGIQKLPLATWANLVEQSKQRQPELTATFSTEVDFVDVAGDAAIAKVRILRNGMPRYIDYLSLYRGEEGWKIVSKVFQEMK